jgi:hypothetical protein
MSVLEAIFYRAPLGLQFADSATGVPVADGLVVTAWPAGDPGSARQAAQSPLSAILGFARLPGLARYEEARTGDPATFSWPAAGPGAAFEVRVTDPVGRYLPELLAVTVPAATLVTPALYSAPARPAPAGFATISGEVHSAATGSPAAWAVVQVDADSASYTTLADQNGRYLVYLPYPEALPPLGGSPGPLTWPLTISVGYQPTAQHLLADATTADPPELGSLLGQAPATISAGGATQPSLAATLTFGTALLVMLEVLPA